MSSHTLDVDTITVAGKLPPSSNHIYYTDFRTRTRHLSQEARAYRDEIQSKMNEAGLKLRHPGPFSVDYFFTLPDRRRRDLSNMIKLLEDTIFSHLGVDDRTVQDFHVWKRVRRGRRHMRVVIRPALEEW